MNAVFGSLNKYMGFGFQIVNVEGDFVISNTSGIPDYPLSQKANPAILIFDEDYGLIRACGGYYEDKYITRECFTFDGVSWMEMPRFPPRAFSSRPRVSVYVKDKGALKK